MFRSTMIAVTLLTGCGYRPPLDQCIGSGTKCRKDSDGSGKNTSVGPRGEKGEPGLPGQAGPAGPAGSSGRDGSNGRDGSSCSAQRTSNGATIQCTDGTGAVIFDGQKGEDGEDAPPTAYSVVEILDPCGDQSGFDEVLLRTASGKWIAHFSGHGDNFLTILTPGTYRTTDSTRCEFTLNAGGQITNEHNY